jgi:hemolysin activation/secretion protein
LTSILLRVDEQRQWSADFGYENSGSRITSEDRLIAGVTWGKAFGLTDHQFRYAFTCDPSLDLLRVHSAQYFAPLPWRHGLRLSGYYLDVKGEDQNTTLEGSAYQASMRYEIPLTAIRKYQHEFSIGLDFKSADNSLFLGSSTPFQNTPTEIFQVAAGYSSVLPDALGRTSFSIQGYYSPGDVTEKNTDEFFDPAHPGAKAAYVYGRVNLERGTRLPANFSWIIRAVGQIADGNLLPSEQLGMGGYASARGYEEREGNGDQGFLISNELRTPPFGFLRLFNKRISPEQEKLQLLGFWDYGEVENVDLQPGDDPHTWFSSIGAGLRYNFTRHFSLRFDYGWQLIHRSGRDDPRLPTPDASRAHVGVVAAF